MNNIIGLIRSHPKLEACPLTEAQRVPSPFRDKSEFIVYDLASNFRHWIDLSRVRSDLC